MTKVARLLGVVLLLLTVAPRNGRAWMTTPELGYGIAVTTTASGNIVSAGESIGTDLFDFSVRLQTALDGADVWRYQLDGSGGDIAGSYNDYAADVALDGAGDVIAAGATRNAGSKLDLQIVKLGAADGVPVWTQVLDSPTHDNDDYRNMALHPAGDVAVAGVFGMTPDTFGPYTFVVTRLAGATGAVLWQHEVAGDPRSQPASVHFDSAGDVLATGTLETAPHVSDVVAVKLDGATGAEVWRTLLNGGDAPVNDAAYAGALDGVGDLYLGGRASTTGGDGFTVYKLSGATGAVLWRYDHSPVGEYAFVTVLSVDGAGALYAGGYVDTGFDLVKLSGASGIPLWNRKYHKGYFAFVTFDLIGDVLLAGSYGPSFAIEKLAAGDGHKRWRRKLRGNRYNGGFANAATVDPAGEVIAVGGHVTPLPRGPVNGTARYTVIKACGENGRVRSTDACP